MRIEESFDHVNYKIKLHTLANSLKNLVPIPFPRIFFDTQRSSRCSDLPSHAANAKK